MNCKACGADYANLDNQCVLLEGHIWPELNEPQPSANDFSAQPCGCDPGAKWLCAWHLMEKELHDREL